MTRYVPILALALALALGAPGAAAQNPYDLPMVCSGLVERYWVRGHNGMSDFHWRIIRPDGQELSTNYWFLDSPRGDTIQVTWAAGLPGGIYTFEVVEHHLGCVGQAYRQRIVLNTHEIAIPFDGVPSTVAVCYGQTAALDPGPFSSYLWEDGASGRIYFTGASGTHRVRLINSAFECTFNQMEAVVNPLPQVWLGRDTLLLGAQELLLDVYSPDLAFYQWSTGSRLPAITVGGGLGDSTVWVQVTDVNGCVASDTVNIIAADFRRLRIPAAFTPNGDGRNDTWLFPAPNSQGFELYNVMDRVDVKVYNRWGKLVWSSSGPFRAWDGRDLGGRELPMDSYHYQIAITVDGHTFEYKGSITIVR